MTTSPLIQPFEPDSQAMTLDLKSALAMIYLAVPIALFLGGWFRPLVALVLLAALCGGLFFALRPTWKTRNATKTSRTWLWTAGLAIAAIGWSCLGGAGHLFFANSDWTIRDAVLRDLSTGAWPPSYRDASGIEVILRAPVAYYLPSASLAQWLGIEWADRLLLAWTTLGVGLFLSLIPLSSHALRGALGVACIVLFSGMDILGCWLLNRSWSPPGTHIEWWATFFQYSSNSTLLFWVPNHALPAWLAMALFFRHWRNPDFLQMAPMLMALLPMWTPFAAIGMSPFYLLLLPAAFREGWRFFNPIKQAPALLLLITEGLYLTLDLTSVPSGLQAGLSADFLLTYGTFCMVEFGLLGLALYRDGKGPLLHVALLTLCVLPFFRVGEANDLVMRASIPALMLLCLVFLRILQNERIRLQDLAGTGVLLLIGSVTPMQEIYRAITLPAWQVHAEDTLLHAAKGKLPTHYVARMNQPLLMSVMRSPSPVTQAEDPLHERPKHHPTTH